MAKKRCFNPRPRTRGDVSAGTSRSRALCFNPRPRTRGDQSPSIRRILIRRFNPRPRTRGDVGDIDGDARSDVSIHAPARGATQAAGDVAYFDGFQSTPPHEGRLVSVVGTAPAGVFQSTPPHEGRRDPGGAVRSLSLFQSTPPHEGRLGVERDANSGGGFNPRPRTRGDERFLAGRLPQGVSIHAPARGATQEP